MSREQATEVTEPMCRRIALERDRGGGELSGIRGRRKWYVGLGEGFELQTEEIASERLGA